MRKALATPPPLFRGRRPLCRRRLRRRRPAHRRSPSVAPVPRPSLPPPPPLLCAHHSACILAPRLRLLFVSPVFFSTPFDSFSQIRFLSPSVSTGTSCRCPYSRCPRRSDCLRPLALSAHTLLRSALHHALRTRAPLRHARPLATPRSRRPPPEPSALPRGSFLPASHIRATTIRTPDPRRAPCRRARRSGAALFPLHRLAPEGPRPPHSTTGPIEGLRPLPPPATRFARPAGRRWCPALGFICAAPSRPRPPLAQLPARASDLWPRRRRRLRRPPRDRPLPISDARSASFGRPRCGDGLLQHPVCTANSRAAPPRGAPLAPGPLLSQRSPPPHPSRPRAPLWQRRPSPICSRLRAPTVALLPSPDSLSAPLPASSRPPCSPPSGGAARLSPLRRALRRRRRLLRSAAVASVIRVGLRASFRAARFDWLAAACVPSLERRNAPPTLALTPVCGGRCASLPPAPPLFRSPPRNSCPPPSPPRRRRLDLFATGFSASVSSPPNPVSISLPPPLSSPPSEPPSLFPSSFPPPKPASPPLSSPPLRPCSLRNLSGTGDRCFPTRTYGRPLRALALLPFVSLSPRRLRAPLPAPPAPSTSPRTSHFTHSSPPPLPTPRPLPQAPFTRRPFFSRKLPWRPFDETSPFCGLGDRADRWPGPGGFSFDPPLALRSATAPPTICALPLGAQTRPRSPAPRAADGGAARFSQPSLLFFFFAARHLAQGCKEGQEPRAPGPRAQTTPRGSGGAAGPDPVALRVRPPRRPVSASPSRRSSSRLSFRLSAPPLLSSPVDALFPSSLPFHVPPRTPSPHGRSVCVLSRARSRDARSRTFALLSSRSPRPPLSLSQ